MAASDSRVIELVVVGTVSGPVAFTADKLPPFATLQGPGGESRVEAGAVIMATGFEPVATTHFADYGLGVLPDVVSSLDMEDLCRAGALRRPSDGEPVRRVAILACDGPRDSANLPYSGAVTSMTALKQAMLVRERDPESQVYVVYEDMQTPGRDELYYRHVQEDHGVFFVRGREASFPFYPLETAPAGWWSPPRTRCSPATSASRWTWWW